MGSGQIRVDTQANDKMGKGGTQCGGERGEWCWGMEAQYRDVEEMGMRSWRGRDTEKEMEI